MFNSVIMMMTSTKAFNNSDEVVSRHLRTTKGKKDDV